MASSIDRTCQSQKPAISSLVSENGPSITDRLFPENLTRAPLELAWSPSPASMTPALASSSLYLPISASSSWLGSTPASEFLSAFTITMTRMFKLLNRLGLSRPGRFPWPPIYTSNDPRRDRHGACHPGFERSLQQPALLQPLGQGGEARSGTLPLELVHIREQLCVGSQGGQALEQEPELLLFAEHGGGEFLDRAILIEQPSCRSPPDAG